MKMKSSSPKNINKENYKFSSISKNKNTKLKTSLNERHKIRELLETKILNHQSLVDPNRNNNNSQIKPKKNLKIRKSRHSVQYLDFKPHNNFVSPIIDSLELAPELKLKQLENQMKNRILDFTVTLFSPRKKKNSIKNFQSIITKTNINNNTSLQKINCNSPIRRRNGFQKKIIIPNKYLKKFRKLRKKKIIYDSMEDNESEDEKNNMCFIFQQDSSFLFIFDFIILISAIFCYFYLSINFAKARVLFFEENIIIECFQYLIDILFIIDILTMFFRGYYDKNHEFIKNKNLVIYHYLQNQITSDIFAGIPVYIFQKYYYHNLYVNKDMNIYLYDTLIRNANFFHYLTLAKIIKIFKVLNKHNNYALKKFSEYMSRYASGEKILQEFLFVINCLICSHLFVCTHIYIGKITYPSWITYADMQNSNLISLYITSLYFMIETMTTVGYGDIMTRSSISSLIFQIILLSVGIVAYSWIITVLGDFVKNETRAQIKCNQNLTLLEEVRLEYSELPFRLYTKIQEHFKSLSHQQNKFDLNIFIHGLPYSLKNKILFTIYEKPIKNFKFFKGKNGSENYDFILRVLTNFIPLFSKKNAILMREGEIPENIIFVKSGCLSLEAAINLRDEEESISNYLNNNLDDENLERNLTQSTKNSNEKSFLQKTKNIAKNKNLLEKTNISKSYIRESFVDDEIGKFDLGECEEGDIENGYYKFLKILDLHTNEYIGEYYLFKNKPIPLSLKVKTKIANIFLLRKSDAVKISIAFPEIWGRISNKSEKNAIAIRESLIKKIRNYCDYKGIIPNDNKKKPRQSRIRMSLMNMYNLKEILQIEKLRKEDKNAIEKIKNSTRKNKSCKSLFSKKSKKSVIEKAKKPLSSNNVLKRISAKSIPKVEDFQQIKRSTKIVIPSSKFSFQDVKMKAKLSLSPLKKSKEKNSHESKSNTIKHHSEEIKKNKKNKKYYKKLCLKLMKTINILKSKTKNKVKSSKKFEINSSSIVADKSNNSSNILENSSAVIETEINLSSFSSSSSSNQNHHFNLNNLKITVEEKFTFNSCYNNLNFMSNGLYIKNTLLREKIQNYLKENNENKPSLFISSVLSPINRKSQETEFLKNTNSDCSSEIQEINNQKQIDNSIFDKNKSKDNKNNNLKKILNYVSKTKNSDNVNDKFKEKDSNISEKSDAEILNKMKDEFYESKLNLRIGGIDYMSLLKKSIDESNKNGSDNKNNNYEFFLDLNGNNNNEYIKKESMKKLNIIKNTTNNVYKIKQINAVKTENNRLCHIF